jgi:multicomponent Na+:H+ antiporter subunit B
MTRHSSLLQIAVRPIYWLMLAAALWIMLRGHNEPGGGFVGGLIAVAASSVLGTVLGTSAARRWQPLEPLPLAIVGVGLAMFSGLSGAAAGLPFLTHVRSNGLSTTILFELGVFSVVWGALSGTIYALLDASEEDQPP